jgi:L-threonylcarbamoyladenylate synthase
MKTLSVKDGPKEAVLSASKTLRAGGLVAVPTETVYGLAADASNGEAVAKIFAAKQRPGFNPLICHVADLAMAENYGAFSPLARRFANKFWPGPLTFVLPLQVKTDIAPLVSAGLNTIALRCPSGIVRDIAQKLGHPLAAPSANTSGRISPTTAAHVADDLGDKVDLILDGGACSVGVESTIIKIEDDKVTLLRAGGITVEQLEAVIKSPLLRSDASAAIEAPGMMRSHYAPRAKMRLNAASHRKGEVLLAFGEGESDTAQTISLDLSPKGDLAEAAANLYDYLKKLDATGAEIIAVQPIPSHGLGEAINDRLRRAAAPRKDVT